MLATGGTCCDRASTSLAPTKQPPSKTEPGGSCHGGSLILPLLYRAKSESRSAAGEGAVTRQRKLGDPCRSPTLRQGLPCIASMRNGLPRA